MSTKLTNPFLFFIPHIGLLVLFLGFSNLMSAKVTTESNDGSMLTINGTVKSAEDGFPMIGVTVQVKDKNRGTNTDVNGQYTVEAEKDDILVFSFLGFETQELPVGGSSQIDVVLSPNADNLDEVLVIGYGQQKKSHVTGSVSKVTNEKLDQIPIGRIDDALVGQVAGVNIQMTNPAAGEAPVIRVRGQGSISFDSNPLIVVDGIAVGSDADFLASIDMADVESMEILKDAASSAIYGSRGANGIILITTKAGQEGPMKLTYDSYVGFKSVPNSGVLTSISEWETFVRDNNDGNLTEQMEYIRLLGNETNWEDVMFDGGMIQNHSLAATGGNKSTKFRASMSYLDDEGVLLTDNYQKINFRLKLDTKISKRVSFGTNINPSHTVQTRFPIGVHDALRQHSWLPLYLDESNIGFVNPFRENGRWADAQVGDYAMERMFDDFDFENGVPSEGSGLDLSGTSNQSALAKVLERDRKKTQTKVYANSYLKIKLAKGLTFKQSVGGDFRYTRNTTWIGVQATRNGAADSEARLQTNQQFHSVTESTLTFKRKYGGHDINAVGGFAFERWDRESSLLEAAGFDSDFIQTIPAANLVGGETFRADEALISYLSRVNYAYNDKYLLSLSARWDGSSKFGPDNKFGFFPAVSLGWRVSQEDFLIDNDFISSLKLRFSYGESGSNSGIGEYDYIGLLSPVGVGYNSGAVGFNPTNISNSELRWERLVEINPGLDMTILDGRFGISADYYIRTSKDLLINLPVPGVTGFESALVNVGEVENKGFELEFRSYNIKTSDLTWSSTLLLTRNENTLKDFAGNDGLISIVDDKRPAEWIALEGAPISSFYGYVVEDEIPLEFINDPFYPIGGQSQDIYVRDLNGDGVIDPDDRTVLGSPYPDLIWSFSNNVRYKNFDFTMMFQGSHGAEVRNISSQYINNEFASRQDFNDDFQDGDLVVQRIFTSDDIQDASYIALRNLNLGYRFNVTKVPGVSSLRVYLSGQNLLYLTSDDYEGWNPEGIDQGLGNPLTYGYQRGPAPIFRTISFGLNVGF